MQDSTQFNLMVARPERRRLLRGLLAGGALLLAGPVAAACGAQPAVPTAPKTEAKPTTGAATTPAAGQTAPKTEAKPAAGTTVEMTDANKFVPETVTVKKGSTVTWKNSGTMAHNVVTDATLAIDKAHAKLPSGAKAFTSPMILGGSSWAQTFEVAGEYSYFCQPHEALGMVGKVVVTE